MDADYDNRDKDEVVRMLTAENEALKTRIVELEKQLAPLQKYPLYYNDQPPTVGRI